MSNNEISNKEMSNDEMSKCMVEGQEEIQQESKNEMLVKE